MLAVFSNKDKLVPRHYFKGVVPSLLSIVILPKFIARYSKYKFLCFFPQNIALILFEDLLFQDVMDVIIALECGTRTFMELYRLFIQPLSTLCQLYVNCVQDSKPGCEDHIHKVK